MYLLTSASKNFVFLRGFIFSSELHSNKSSLSTDGQHNHTIHQPSYEKHNFYVNFFHDFISRGVHGYSRSGFDL